MADEPLTSWTLVLGAAGGSAPARDVFAARYGPAIAAYFAARWRLRPDEDRVFDATQDTLVECFKAEGALSRVDPVRPGGFRAYLYGIARNVALMAERRSARRREVSAGEGLDVEAGDRNEATLSLVFDRAFVRGIVREARERMARRSIRSPAAEARYRVLALQFEHDQPPREIAARLALPVERVYELLKEARREYRDCLVETVASLHPGCSQAEVERHCVDLIQRLA